MNDIPTRLGEKTGTAPPINNPDHQKTNLIKMANKMLVDEKLVKNKQSVLRQKRPRAIFDRFFGSQF